MEEGSPVRSKLERAFREQLEKKGISFDPAYLAEVQRVLLNSESQMRRASTLFCDLCDYVKIVDRIGPLRASKLLAKFYEIGWQVIHRHRGFVLKHIGDAVVAVFGAPIAYDRDVESCVRAAVEIRDLICSLEVDGGVSLNCHVGIATGEVFSGVRGDGATKEYDITGHAINLAARLQARAKPGEILLCQATAIAVWSSFEVEPMSRMRLKNVRGLYMPYRILKENPRGEGRRTIQTRFIGRQSEILKINSALQRADNGHREIVEIVGEPGIGKSRLVKESIRGFKGDIRVLSVECHPHGSESLLLPLIELVQQMCNIESGDSTDAVDEKVERFSKSRRTRRLYIMAIKYLLGLPDAVEAMKSVPFSAIRRRIFEAMFNIVISSARRKLSLLWIDDIQWMDSQTAAWLTFLVNQAADARLAIVLVYRAREKPRMDLPTAATRIRLGPLSQRFRSEMLEEIMGDVDLNHQVTEVIHNRAAGNPLFLEEVTRLIAQEDRSSGGVSIERVAELLADSLPESLHSVLQYRIDRLERRTRAVLERAAVLGRRFSYNMVRLFDAIRDSLFEQLSVLRGLQFIEENPKPSDVEYAFLHPLAREVAYYNLPEDVRSSLHGEIASRMEAHFDANLPVYFPTLAYHFEKAGNADKSLYYLIKSAQRAASLFANREALEFYERAHRTISGDQGDRSTQVLGSALLTAIGRYRRVLGDTGPAEESLRRSLQIAEELENECLISNCRYELSALFQTTGDYGEAKLLATRALEGAKEQDDLTLTAQCLNILGLIAWSQSYLSNALDYFRQVLDIASHNIPAGCIADAHNNTSMIHWQRGEYRIGLLATEKAMKIARTIGDRYRIAAYVMNRGGLEERIGQFRRARKSYENAINLSREIGYSQATCVSLVNLSNLDLTLGNPREALQNAEEASDLANDIGDLKAKAAAGENVALACVQLRDFGLARIHFGRALRIAQKLGDIERQVSVKLGMIELDLAAGKSRLSARRSRDLLKMIEEYDFGEHQPRALRNHARILAQSANRTDEAKDVMERALCCAKQISNIAEQKACRRYLDLFHAEKE